MTINANDWGFTAEDITIIARMTEKLAAKHRADRGRALADEAHKRLAGQPVSFDTVSPILGDIAYAELRPLFTLLVSTDDDALVEVAFDLHIQLMDICEDWMDID